MLASHVVNKYVKNCVFLYEGVHVGGHLPKMWGVALMSMLQNVDSSWIAHVHAKTCGWFMDT